MLFYLMLKSYKKTFISIVVLLFAVIFSSIIVFLSIQNTVFSFKKNDYIYVPIGSSLGEILEKMEDKFNLGASTKIKIYTKFKSIDSDIKPGRHYLYNVKSIPHLLDELTSSLNIDIKVQILEGKTIKQIASMLNKNKKLIDFDSARFLNLCYDRNLIKEIFNDSYFHKVTSLEGFLFPDTYRVKPSYDEKDLIKTFVYNFLNKIEPYHSDMKYKSIDTLMIIASIIQAETANVEEMRNVSSLYYNRINKNMSLDSDVTITYSIGRQMKASDKFSDDPYNTYDTEEYKLRLPPTPINSPGIDAIKAALYPAKTDYLFMFSPIAMNSHFFTETYDSHEAIIDSIKASQ